MIIASPIYKSLRRAFDIALGILMSDFVKWILKAVWKVARFILKDLVKTIRDLILLNPSVFITLPLKISLVIAVVFLYKATFSEEEAYDYLTNTMETIHTTTPESLGESLKDNDFMLKTKQSMDNASKAFDRSAREIIKKYGGEEETDNEINEHIPF